MATRTSTKSETIGGFSAQERAAMKERAAEVRAEARRQKGEEAEAAVRAKIAEMPEPDRTMGERLHALVTETAPALAPKLWYGMPAYAKDGKVLCFFQPASKFSARYATLGFNDVAALDDGAMWPTTFALSALTPHTEAQIRALVARAVG